MLAPTDQARTVIRDNPEGTPMRYTYRTHYAPRVREIFKDAHFSDEDADNAVERASLTAHHLDGSEQFQEQLAAQLPHEVKDALLTRWGYLFLPTLWRAGNYARADVERFAAVLYDITATRAVYRAALEVLRENKFRDVVAEMGDETGDTATHLAVVFYVIGAVQSVAGRPCQVGAWAERLRRDDALVSSLAVDALQDCSK